MRDSGTSSIIQHTTIRKPSPELQADAQHGAGALGASSDHLSTPVASPKSVPIFQGSSSCRCPNPISAALSLFLNSVGKVKKVVISRTYVLQDQVMRSFY